jgi:hypothetical protein
MRSFYGAPSDNSMAAPMSLMARRDRDEPLLAPPDVRFALVGNQNTTVLRSVVMGQSGDMLLRH